MSRPSLENIVDSWIEKWGKHFGDKSFNIHFKDRDQALSELLATIKQEGVTLEEVLEGLMYIVECCIPETSTRQKAGYGHKWVKSLSSDIYSMLVELGLNQDESYADMLYEKICKKTGVKTVEKTMKKSVSDRPKKPKKFSGEKLLQAEDIVKFATAREGQDLRDTLINKVLSEELPPASRIPDDADDILLGDSEEGLAFAEYVRSVFSDGVSKRGDR